MSTPNITEKLDGRLIIIDDYSTDGTQELLKKSVTNRIFILYFMIITKVRVLP